MATKFKLLVAILLTSLTAFSQAGITKQDSCSIKISCNVAKRIAIDLVRGDSVRAELATTQHILELTEEELIVKDGIIAAYEQKDITYQEMMAALDQKSVVLEGHIQKLEKANRKQTRLVKFFRTAAGVLAATALVVFLIK